MIGAIIAFVIGEAVGVFVGILITALMFAGAKGKKGD